MRALHRNSLFGAGMIILSAGAGAQDLGNALALADQGAANVANLTGAVVSADLQQTLDVTASTVDTAGVNLVDSTPLEMAIGDLGQMTGTVDVDRALGESLPADLAPGIPVLAQVDRLMFIAPLLGDGIPLIAGERQMLTLMVEQGFGLDLGLTPQVNRALKVDLLPPGDNDGGGVLLGGSALSGLGALPLEALVLMELPLEGLSLPGVPLGGDLGPLGSQGLALDAIPFDLVELDSGTQQALLSGLPLPGL